MNELLHTDIVDLALTERVYPIGAKVRYYPVIPHTPGVTPPPREGSVTSRPWIHGGMILLRITGQNGAVSIFHLEAVT